MKKDNLQWLRNISFQVLLKLLKSAVKHSHFGVIRYTEFLPQNLDFSKVRQKGGLSSCTLNKLAKAKKINQ